MSVTLCCTISTGSDGIIHPRLVRLQLCMVLYLAFEKTQVLITFSREAVVCSAKGQTISFATFNHSQSYWVCKNDSLFFFPPSSAVLLVCRKKNSVHNGSRPDSCSKQTNTFSWARSRVATHEIVSNDQVSCWRLNITLLKGASHSLQETKAIMFCKLLQRGKGSVITLIDACSCARW